MQLRTKKTTLLITSWFLSSPMSGAAQATDNDSTETCFGTKQTSATLELVPLIDALDREFRPLYATRPDGPWLHVLSGDPTTGPSLTLFRYSRNYAGSRNLHSHTHDYRLWLIEGALKHWDEHGSEETAIVLAPGSYLHQPANELHAANCVSKQCTAYVIFDGAIETTVPKE